MSCCDPVRGGLLSVRTSTIYIVVPSEQPHHPPARGPKQHDNETFDAEGHDSGTFLGTENLHREGRGEKCDSRTM